MFMGTEATCSKEGVVLKKLINLSFDMIDVAEVIIVRKLANVDVIESSSSEVGSFSQGEFDNLYGCKNMQMRNTNKVVKLML